MKRIKTLAFSLTAVIIVTLIAATIIEQLYGTEYAHDHVYTSPWVIALWGVCCILSIIYVVSKASKMGVVTMSLHVSFIVILIGALSTHLTGEEGKIHLRKGEANNQYVVKNDEKRALPFSLTLQEFTPEYYPGTQAPMDYVSKVVLSDGSKGEVSMNNVLKHDNYRFYQSSYDSDGEGTTLIVTHDPYGITITYCGYAMLLISMLLFFVQKRSRYRALLKSTVTKSAVVLLAVFGSAFSMSASDYLPQTVDKETAESLGDLYIYYNDRVAPLETYARDFTQKIYGKPSYRGYNSVQVLAGWLLFYDDWKREPMIKIKEGKARQCLGIDGNYASLADFVSIEGFKLEAPLQGDDFKEYLSANEKFNLISSVATGAAIKIYPITVKDGATPEWVSPSDNLPSDMDENQWVFIKKSLNLIAQCVYENDTKSVVELIASTKKYQEKVAGAENLPVESRFKAEKFYNKLPATKTIAIICLVLGLVGYGLMIKHLLGGQALKGEMIIKILLGVLTLYLTVAIGLRWYISNHIPLSNGFETMQFMAWSCAVIALLLSKRLGIVSGPAGLMICGFALLVAGIGESNPQITQLMPVLASPLLSAHVVIIMISYALFAFIMLNGVTALIMHKHEEQVAMLHRISLLALYPAVFMLTIGIFIGAVWANQSWGTYWSWDPKETWALITMLIYAFLLHDNSIKLFRKPIVFHGYTIIAFLAVLMTYFGVNFVLGGMHSYAG